jgi:hypothetical protein
MQAGATAGPAGSVAAGTVPAAEPQVWTKQPFIEPNLPRKM